MTTEFKSAQERIKDYLDERARQDELFAKSYAKTNKNIDECYEYIVGEARKKAYQTNKMASNANKKSVEAKKESADANKSKTAKIQQLNLFDFDEL